MSSPVISVRHLKRGFKSGSGSITVLKDISLTVNRGEFVAVMGASGSGKSTLLNVLGGLLAPDSGTVTVDGMDLGSMSDASLTVYRRDRVGFIFQMFNLVGTLNVEENILLPSLAGGRRVAPAALDAMSPMKVLGRGYAIARDGEGRVLSSVKQTGAGEKLTLRLADGSLRCHVDQVQGPEQEV